MCCVDDEGVDASVDEGLAAFEAGVANSGGGGDAQATLLVLAGVRVGLTLFHVLDGEQANAAALLINHDQPLDAVLMQQLTGFGRVNAGADGDDFLRHQFRDGHVVVFGEADVAVGDDAKQLLGHAFGAWLDHRDAGHAQAFLQDFQLAERYIRRDGDRVDHHAAFEALHAADLFGLLLDREVAVNDADTAELGHGYGKARLGNRIHGGRDDRHVDGDVAGETRTDIDIARDDFGRSGFKQHVVERDGLADAD